jgi:hypothetical protein
MSRRRVKRPSDFAEIQRRKRSLQVVNLMTNLVCDRPQPIKIAW